MEEKDDRDRLHPSPSHQLLAGGMTTVGQQHLRAKRLQNLVGQVEKAIRFLHLGRTLGAAGGGAHERVADAAYGQFNDLDRRRKVGRPCHNRVPQIGPEPLGRQVKACEHLPERCLAFIIEDPGRGRPTIRPARGEQLPQFAH
jgi:hypothetical protein